ncbi:hypothetical protein U9M48_028617 [Paspalum notatum var. saurae]|uniref:Retrovirus-related Pol polyprotein from transposon TNT 1-94 n=1 Tax=Paspalum notatum var. saurae TaxID=547442 RepID=A0AAQ3X0S7_PASNO
MIGLTSVPDGDQAGHLVRAVKRIFRYLKFTLELGLWYSSGSSLSLRGFSDADHAGCWIDRKSTSGTCQLLGTSLVSLSSRKQASVALSTTEAEYVAAASCCSQLLWMKATLSDFGLRFGKIPLLVDSTSAISVAKNPGDIDLVHVISANQLADIFTKPLEFDAFTRLRGELGVLQVEGVDNALIKGEIGSEWTGLIALLSSDGLEVDDEDLDGLRQKPSNGQEATLGIGRPWKLGTRRGGSATVV